MSARYAIRGLLGVILGSAAIVVASLEIYHLVRTGSCASGGPYVSARPCPSGTGLRIVALIASIFVIGPLSVFIFGSRAKGVKGVAGAGALVGLLWTFGWIGMGSAAWVAGHGPAHPASGGEGSTGVAITFWAIGGISLLGLILGAGGARAGARVAARATANTTRTPPPAPAPAPAPRPVRTPPPASAATAQRLAATLGAVAAKKADDAEVGDVARRLKQLDELKAMGAVTAAEYDAKRRDILGEI